MKRPRNTDIDEEDEEDVWEYRSIIKRAKKSSTGPQSQKNKRVKLRKDRDPGKPRQNSTQLNEHQASCSFSNGSNRDVNIYDNQQGDAECKGSGSERIVNSDSTTCSQIPSSSATQKRRGVKSSSGKKSRNAKHQTPAKARTPQEGYCPFCQMPFAALIVQSPNWHVTECMETDIDAQKECPRGRNCDSTLPSHYRNFKHTELALSRATSTPAAALDSTYIGADFNTGEISPPSASPYKGNKSGKKSHRKLQFNNRNIDNGHLSDTSNNLEIKQSNHGEDNLEHPHNASFHSNNIDSTLILNRDGNDNDDHRMNFPSLNSSPNLLHTAEKGVRDCVLNKKRTNHVESANQMCGTVSGEDIFGKSETIQVDKIMDTFEQDVDFEKLICDAQQTQSEFGDCDIGDSNWDGVMTQSSKNDCASDCINGTDVLTESCAEGFTETSQESEVADIIGEEVKIETLFVRRSTEMQHWTSNTCGANVGATKQTSLHSFFKYSGNKPGKQPPSVGLISKKNTTNGVKSLPSTAQGRSPRKSQFGQEYQSGTTSSSSTSTVQTSHYDRSKRQCPFYKRIPGTPFTVDAFSYGSVSGCKAYILSHFHYDHYNGLTKHFKHPIYCSKITANLVKMKIRVSEEFLHPLPLNQPTIIEGVEVTMLEANHCPGAVLILFRLKSGKVFLHTGDFRAHPSMEDYPHLKGISINQLYLDTTYCDPSYAFPPQDDVISRAVIIATDAVYENPNTLIVCGCYTIGKERIFKAIAEALNCKICVQREKKRVLDCLEDPQLKKMLTLKWEEARVHVLPMGSIKIQSLQRHLDGFKGLYDSILAFEPTGWTHSKRTLSLENLGPKEKKNGIKIYGIPYSEHSSYTELKRFVQFTRPQEILPTVNNGSQYSRHKMQTLFKSWLEEGPQKLTRQSSMKGYITK